MEEFIRFWKSTRLWYNCWNTNVIIAGSQYLFTVCQKRYLNVNLNVKILLIILFCPARRSRWSRRRSAWIGWWGARGSEGLQEGRISSCIHRRRVQRKVSANLIITCDFAVMRSSCKRKGADFFQLYLRHSRKQLKITSEEDCRRAKRKLVKSLVVYHQQN